MFAAPAGHAGNWPGLAGGKIAGNRGHGGHGGSAGPHMGLSAVTPAGDARCGPPSRILAVAGRETSREARVVLRQEGDDVCIRCGHLRCG